jgi:hypothetical protein
MQHSWGPPQYPASHAPYGTLVALWQIGLFQKSTDSDNDSEQNGSESIWVFLRH